MSPPRAEVEDLLERKPELREAFAEILRLDREGPWSVHDLPVEPGPFGEIAALSAVEEEGDGYRLSDRGAVEEALRGTRDRRIVAALAGALLLIAAFRSLHLPSVFRRGDVVLMGNDPYHYLYWVERLAAESASLLDLGVSAGLPGAVAKGEPFMITSLWWVSELLGGVDAAGPVMAIYPVASAVVTGLAVYGLTSRVTGDRWAGVLAAAMLAVTPGHAFRTALGLADHHAFDYVWLGLTLLLLVELERRGSRDTGTWVLAAALGLAVAAQALAWDNGPIILFPIALYGGARSVDDGLEAVAPLAGALGLAGLVTHAAHSSLGWHTDQVAYSPLLILGAVLALGLAAAAARRLGLSRRGVAASEVGVAAALFIGLRAALPKYAARLDSRLGVLFRSVGPLETQSLVAGDLGFVRGPYFFFGLLLLAALPFLALATHRLLKGKGRAWLPVAVYAWYFLALSLVQRRFTGELAVAVAPLAAAGVLLVADRYREKVPLQRHRVAASVLVVLVIFGLAAVPPTSQMMSSVETPPSAHDAAVWMEGHAEEQGWSEGESYAFSHWGRNRMYNYFVNGDSRSYGYAKNNYEDFVSSTDGEKWFERLDGRAGFVVTSTDGIRVGSGVPGDVLIKTLHGRFGSASPDSPGSAHFRAVYSSGDGSVKVFEPVAGATLRGQGPPDSGAKISTRVTVPGADFEYTRVVETDENGSFSVTVPYPGYYEVAGKGAMVSVSDVENGETVRLDR